MSVEDHTVSFSIETNVEPAMAELRRLQTVLYRSLGLIRRLSGDENLNAAIALIQRTIAIINQLRLALAALQAARMAAGDPIAWALAGISMAEVVVSTYEVTAR